VPGFQPPVFKNQRNGEHRVSFLPPEIIFGLDSLCPTLFVKVFTVMKNCEQLWLVTGTLALYQGTVNFRLKGNV
jgi:hypothetical protein